MTIAAASSRRTHAAALGARGADLRSVVDFYTCTDADYGAWSKDFNMHFGLCEPGMNPLDRESMLARMNAAVLRQLALPAGSPRVVDLGCGTGATARALVRARPGARVSAVTIVPAQIARGKALNAGAGTSHAIEFVLGDYLDTRLASGAYDGACAVESACHAPGPDKRALLEEAHRLLKPAGRLVIADCFLKHARPLPWATRLAYRAWCSSWAVPELANLEKLRGALQETGFADIEIADVSWKVAPSVAHVPVVATRFLLAELWKCRGRLPRWRRRHIAASWLSILLGLCRGSFGYYLVTARKAG
jgi:SAM-dependent methyltransferase